MAKVKDTEVEQHLTIEQIKEIQRDYTKALNQNEVFLACEVVSNFQTTPKAMKDREGNDIYDQDSGEQKFYNPNFSVKLAFNGGEKEIDVTQEWFNDLQIDGSRYLFSGRLGVVKKFGKESIDIIFNNYTLL